MGPPQYPLGGGGDQEGGGRYRPRPCLLKGCERSFRPSHPQCRYCSEGCRQAARRWRRWQAAQRYRASAAGKERRREQSRRYRQRRRTESSVGGVGVGGVNVRMNTATALTISQSGECAAGAEAAAGKAEAPREGQRPASKSLVFIERPCVRPGCYEMFAVSARSPARRFCSCSCRKALRRVLDREAHWRRRLRRAKRSVGAGRRRAPDSS